MKKKTSICIGLALLIGAVCFLAYALNHPEASLPLGNKAAYMLYGMYLWLIFHFLVVAPLRKERPKGSALRAAIYFLMAAVFLVMELLSKTDGLFSLARGVVILGALDVAVDDVLLLRKQAKGK